MKRILGFLRRASARELIYRCREATFVGTEAIRVASGRDRWRRDTLGSQLVRLTPEIAQATEALARQEWGRAGASLRAHFLQRDSRFVLDPARRGAAARRLRSLFPECREDAIADAERLLAGRYDLLGYRDVSFSNGCGVDWHFDPVLGRRAPIRFWSRVQYLDPRYGDHKVIWELNRHQHWLALGRAAWLTADKRYEAAVAAELASWLEANPPLRGVNWSSMLELALRSISWIWALHFFAALEDAHDSAWFLDLLVGLNRQLTHVARHLSLYFSPNTHLLGEGLALYVAGRTLPELRAAAGWEQTGRAVLVHEARAQIHADGGHAELSTHYHRYALDFYLLALTIARKTNDPVAECFEDVTSRLATFCRAVADDEGRLPGIGDDDGGRLFPICNREPSDVRDSLALAASLLWRPELAIGAPPEETVWMLGGEDVPAASVNLPRLPGAEFFPDSGYVVLRSPGSHAVLDAGRHGFLNAGHAHADALSLVLTVAGRPLLIDPGTATYTVSREARDRFRSTAMHNTVVVDGRSQSLPAGPFQWSSTADAHLDRLRTSADFDYVEAWHDGYLPLVHRRAVVRVGGLGNLWLVIDHILDQTNGPAKDHRADVSWHFGPEWTLERTEPLHCSLVHRDGFRGALGSTADHQSEMEADAQGLGWCAPVYGRMLPAPTLRASKSGPAPFSLITAIAAAPAPVRLSVRGIPVAVERKDGWHRAAARVICNGACIVGVFAAPGAAAGMDRRSTQRITLETGELETDARAAVLRFDKSGEPVSLDLIDGTVAAWAGRGPFSTAPLAEAGDLHLDASALRQIRIGAGDRERGEPREESLARAPHWSGQAGSATQPSAAKVG